MKKADAEVVIGVMLLVVALFAAVMTTVPETSDIVSNGARTVAVASNPSPNTANAAVANRTSTTRHGGSGSGNAAESTDDSHTSAGSILPQTTKEDAVQINEQFDGDSLDEKLWVALTRPQGYRNNEEQAYRPSQVSVNNGMLAIRATRDTDGKWYSGEVNSKWQFTYGEFEVRLALTAVGPGVWPAAWIMGATDIWPNGGEIDIFESINDEPVVYGTMHGGGPAGHWQLQSSKPAVDVRQYHTYKVVKKPGHVSWWLDGVKYGERNKAELPAGAVWPFEDHRNFGLLNLAIGGTWPGASNEKTPSEVTMYVDSFVVRNAY